MVCPTCIEHTVTSTDIYSHQRKSKRPLPPLQPNLLAAAPSLRKITTSPPSKNSKSSQHGLSSNALTSITSKPRKTASSKPLTLSEHSSTPLLAISLRTPTDKSRAQNLAPKSHSQLAEYLQILDPSSDGYVTYPHFLEICAIQLNNKDNTTTDEDVDAAMKLFTRGVSRPITIQDLRGVAKTLKEDVGEDVLRAMVLEANGGEGVGRGVEKEAFRGVMVRAGVFQ